MKVSVHLNKELTTKIINKLLKTEAGAQYVLGSLRNSVYIPDDSYLEFHETEVCKTLSDWLDLNCNDHYWWESNRLYFFSKDDMLKFKLAMDGVEIEP